MPAGIWRITFTPVDGEKPIEPIEIDWSVADDLRSIPIHVASTYGVGLYDGTYRVAEQGGDITRDGAVVAYFHVEKR